jgi:Arc/MetJ-type ribon-helix-helix transcriptional regulator
MGIEIKEPGRWWYRSGTVDRMSIQVAVRLPEGIVAFIDEEIAAGNADSRAEVIYNALEREYRLRCTERDLVVMMERKRRGEHDEGDDIARWRSENPLDLSDLD